MPKLHQYNGKEWIEIGMGSPDTPNQIADKLNTLSEIIEQDTIKELKNDLEKLQKSIEAVRQIRAGGIFGGGRQPRFIHQTFDGDNTTTAFTLSAEPTAKGLALWVDYNGQNMHPTEDYTLAGRTLTMNFAPASGSKLRVKIQYQ